MCTQIIFYRFVDCEILIEQLFTELHVKKKIVLQQNRNKLILDIFFFSLSILRIVNDGLQWVPLQRINCHSTSALSDQHAAIQPPGGSMPVNSGLSGEESDNAGGGKVEDEEKWCTG